MSLCNYITSMTIPLPCPPHHQPFVHAKRANVIGGGGTQNTSDTLSTHLIIKDSSNWKWQKIQVKQAHAKRVRGEV